jgi:hypothetical protein
MVSDFDTINVCVDGMCMKVAERGGYRVYVYREVGQPHHLPHCNVRWADGDTQVELPTLREIIGTPLPRVARQLLVDELGALIAAWNDLNPEGSVR